MRSLSKRQNQGGETEHLEQEIQHRPQNFCSQAKNHFSDYVHKPGLLGEETQMGRFILFSSASTSLYIFKESDKWSLTCQRSYNNLRLEKLQTKSFHWIRAFGFVREWGCKTNRISASLESQGAKQGVRGLLIFLSIYIYAVMNFSRRKTVFEKFVFL